MSLPHILLGMLKTPRSGYDLKKEFSTCCQHFWHAELSQIYPALKKMQREGLLISRAGEQGSGPQRLEYQRTEAGRQALLDWLAQGPVTGSERIACLGQIHFLGELDKPKKAIAFFKQLHKQMDSWLAELEAADKQGAEQHAAYLDALPDAEFYSALCLQLAIDKVRSNRDWCLKALKRIKKRTGKSKKKSSV